MRHPPNLACFPGTYSFCAVGASAVYGLDKKQIRMIKKMKTRWCCCFRNYPMVRISTQSMRR